MSTATAEQQTATGLIRLSSLSDAAIWLGVFAGGFVLFEPSAYELILALAVPIFFLCGLPAPRSAGLLLALAMLFPIGGLIAVTQVSPDLFRDGFLYVAISLFLALSAFWYAALVADDPRRVRIIERAMIASAVVASLIGVLAYFHLIPGADQFLLYGRARGTFKDPNVFGPYLVLPALILSRRLLVRGGSAVTNGALLLLLTLGIFLSFSRAAWGLLIASEFLLVLVVAATAKQNRGRLRVLAVVVAGAAAVVAMVAIAASIPAVQEILVQRAKLVQDYDGRDGAELGRFARHWAGFMIAVETPLGLGPFEFPRRYIEATHNTYLKALLEYGWLGFAAYATLVIATVRRGLPLLVRPGPWQGFAQCVTVAFLVHLAVGWVIDTDHWRHVFLMIGVIWGLAAIRALPKMRAARIV